MQETLFDFTSDKYPQTTATIKQLLNELNKEQDRKEGNLLAIKDLKTVTNLLEKLSGIKFNSINEEHPIRDIKAIKTLYKANSGVKGQLINHLNNPTSNRFRTDEIYFQKQQQGKFHLETTKIKNDLLLEATLPDTLSSVQELEYMLNDHIDFINKFFFDEIINKKVSHQSDLSYKLDHLTIDHYRQLTEHANTNKNKKASIFDALLIHIIGFNKKHRLHFETHPENQPSTKKPSEIAKNKINNLLLKMSNDQQLKINPYKLITENEKTVKFFKKYSKELSKVTSHLTDHEIKSRQTEKDLETAQKVLKIVYFLDTDNQGNITETKVTTMDVICALCTVNHQRLNKNQTKRQTYNTAYKTTSPQKIINQFLNSDTVDIPPTVKNIYEKTFWMYISLINNTAKHRKILDELETELKRFHLEILGFKNIEIAINSLFLYEHETRDFFNRFFNDHNITKNQLEIIRNLHPGIITVD